MKQTGRIRAMFSEVTMILIRARATAIEDGLGIILLFTLLVGCLQLSMPL